MDSMQAQGSRKDELKGQRQRRCEVEAGGMQLLAVKIKRARSLGM